MLEQVFFFFTICKVLPETTFEIDKNLTGLKELKVSLALFYSEVDQGSKNLIAIYRATQPVLQRVFYRTEQKTAYTSGEHRKQAGQMYWWDSSLTGLDTKTINGGIRMDLNCGSQVQLLNS